MARHGFVRDAAIASLCGLAYWGLVSMAIDGGEPWDAGHYWTLWYPGALLLAAALGFARPDRAWAWGLIVLLAQVPVVAIVSGVGPLLLAGLVYASVLSIPAMLLSWGGGWLRRRRRGSR